MEWVCYTTALFIGVGGACVALCSLFCEPIKVPIVNYYNADKEVAALRHRCSPQSYQVELNKIIIQRQRIAAGL